MANGLVGGAPTEYNLVMRRGGVAARDALDPAVIGLKIPPGGRLEIEHVKGFARNVGTTIAPNANIILTIGPQNPIVSTPGPGPQHGNWSVDDGGDNTVAIVPRGPDGLEGERAKKIGLKVVHLRPNPRSGNGPAIYTNGAVGTVAVVEVRIVNGSGKVVARGRGEAVFASAGAPAVHVSNGRLQSRGQAKAETTDVQLVESVDFQRVNPSAELIATRSSDATAAAGYAPMFLLFAAADEQPDAFIPQRGIAGVGVRIDPNDPSRGTIVRDANNDGVLGADDPQLGTTSIVGPAGAMPRLVESSRLTKSGDGQTGANGSVLTVPVGLGAKLGRYTVVVQLDGGARAVVTLIAR